MASSSQVNWKFEAKYGRLLHVNRAWCGESTDDNGYLEIRFDNVTMLNAVAMQGDPNGKNYVNEFKMHVKETSAAAMVEKMVSKVRVGRWVGCSVGRWEDRWWVGSLVFR